MPSLIDILFSWTLKDIFNQYLYKDKVNKIPETFTSVEHYVNSFRNPLLEETRAELSSSMNNLTQSPTCEIKYLGQYKDSKPHELLYTLVVEKKVEDKEKKVEKNIVDKEVYVPRAWDVIAFSDVKSASVEDLNRLSYIPAVIEAVDDEGKSYVVRIHASKPLEFDEGAQKKIQKLFAVFLVNTTTNCRIWRALNGRNLSIIEEVLDAAPLDAKCVLGKDLHEDLLSFNLNAPQREAMLNSVLSSACPHKSSVKLIWGPPGTGKTKTVATLLWTLLEMKCRTLTCAPTNTAVVEVTSRLMDIVKHKLKHCCYGLGDIVLLGNGERMKIDVHDDLHEVFLDYRCKLLAKCFLPFTGWSSQLQAMISLFEDPYKMYLDYLRSLEDKEKSGKCQQDQEDEVGISESNQTDEGVTEKRTLEKGNVCQNKKLQYCEYFMKKFHEIRKAMKFCIYCMCTHMPTSQLSEKVVKDMDRTLIWLRAIKSMLSTGMLTDEVLKKVFSKFKTRNCTFRDTSTLSLRNKRKVFLQILRSLEEFQVPKSSDIERFCLQNALLTFCTASSSAKLYGIKELKVLVIDEAAQLKECETSIPLQLPDVQHAILIGDERQLPAMVQSKISEKAEFGRSLFGRLVALGHKRHLLSVQYRMHPLISSFPNSEFYSNQISDASNVKETSYTRHLLEGNMFGPYSFINVSYGEEDCNYNFSYKNMLEVAVISEIVEYLFEASIAKRQTTKVGIISPYKAQVVALNEKLGDKYGGHSDFSVIVRSVDGFQGGEEDVIIVSTVRSNASGLVGFLSNPQRTNVSLTRARYCLWIVGNALTLGKNKSVWKKLVTDARNRGCFFNADNDERLRGAIINSLVELDQIDLFNTSSLVFKWSRWKVIYTENFVSSWLRIENVQTRKEIVAMLIKLSSGWRHHPQKPINLENRDGISSQLLEQYDIDGKLNVLWSVDVREEDSKCIQVLKFWDILPSTDMPKLAESLDHIFEGYTIDTLNRCKFKCLEGSLEIPKTWEIHQVAEQNYTSKTNSDLSTELASLSLGSKPYIKDPRSRKEILQPKQFWQPKQRRQQVAGNQ